MIRVYENVDITQYYAEFRPKFQNCVVDAVMRFHNEHKAHDGGEQVMVDVACGSGQATTAFRQHFSRIIGIDVSPNQIKQARKANAFDHISYQVGTAEELPLPKGSVDLLTSATACHRFNLPKFFIEARRALKPDGTLALLCYKTPKVVPLDIENDVLKEELSLRISTLLDEYEDICNDQRSNTHKNSRYEHIYHMLPAEKKLWIPDGLVMEYQWDLVQLLGYYRSLAAYHEYKKMKKEELGIGEEKDFDEHDRAQLLRKFVKQEWGMEERADQDIRMKVEFHPFVVLGSELHALDYY